MKTPRAPFVILELCCCDEHGGFQGLVNSVDLYVSDGKTSVQIVTLEHASYPDFKGAAPVTFHGLKEGALSPWNEAVRSCELSGEKIKVLTHPQSGGNIFWLTFTTPIQDASHLLIALRSSGQWSWTDALSWFGDTWDDEGLSAPQLTAALHAEFSEA